MNLGLHPNILVIGNLFQKKEFETLIKDEKKMIRSDALDFIDSKKFIESIYKKVNPHSGVDNINLNGFIDVMGDQGLWSSKFDGPVVRVIENMIFLKNQNLISYNLLIDTIFGISARCGSEMNIYLLQIKGGN